MSSIGAAIAASTTVPAPIKSRETLWTGGIVKMKVPSFINDGVYDNGEEELSYLHFFRPIRGGGVNMFVHSDDTRLVNTTIRASVTVIKKIFTDGREYLHIDLKPVPDDTPVTHRLSIMNKGQGSWDDGSHLIFETPPPLSGLIILSPPTAKIVAAETLSAEARQSNDVQLARLLSQGWLVDSEDKNDVFLFKLVNDQRKTLTHHRPKPAAKRKRK